MRIRRAAPLLTACLLACGDDPAPAPTVAEVRVAPEAWLLEVGDTLRFTATARTEGGDVLEVPLAWSSSAPHVAAVDEGLVTALTPGSADIRAAAGGVVGSALVEVRAEPSLTLEPPSAFLGVGSWMRLLATPAGVGDARVTWESGAPGIASVEAVEVDGMQMGEVTGHAPGTAEIVAGVEGFPGLEATATVTVLCPSGPSIAPTNPTVIEGDEVRFTASEPVTWSSSNTTVATIDAGSGLATTHASGSTLITATPQQAEACGPGSTTLTVTPKRYGISVAGFERPDGTGLSATALSGEVVVVVNRDAPANAGVAELVLLLDGAIVAREAYTSGAGQSRPSFDSRAYANGSHQIGAQLLKGDGSVVATASNVPVTIAN